MPSIGKPYGIIFELVIVAFICVKFSKVYFLEIEGCISGAEEIILLHVFLLSVSRNGG